MELHGHTQAPLPAVAMALLSSFSLIPASYSNSARHWSCSLLVEYFLSSAVLEIIDNNTVMSITLWTQTTFSVNDNNEFEMIRLRCSFSFNSVGCMKMWGTEAFLEQSLHFRPSKVIGQIQWLNQMFISKTWFKNSSVAMTAWSLELVDVTRCWFLPLNSEQTSWLLSWAVMKNQTNTPPDTFNARVLPLSKFPPCREIWHCGCCMWVQLSHTGE